MTGAEGGMRARSPRGTASSSGRSDARSDQLRAAAFSKDAEGNYIHAGPNRIDDFGPDMDPGRCFETDADRRAEDELPAGARTA
jgi:hypothetical protein